MVTMLLIDALCDTDDSPAAAPSAKKYISPVGYPSAVQSVAEVRGGLRRRSTFMMTERITHFSTITDIIIFCSRLEATNPRVIITRVTVRPPLPLRAVSRP